MTSKNLADRSWLPWLSSCRLAYQISYNSDRMLTIVAQTPAERSTYCRKVTNLWLYDMDTPSPLIIVWVGYEQQGVQRIGTVLNYCILQYQEYTEWWLITTTIWESKRAPNFPMYAAEPLWFGRIVIGLVVHPSFTCVVVGMTGCVCNRSPEALCCQCQYPSIIWATIHIAKSWLLVNQWSAVLYYPYGVQMVGEQRRSPCIRLTIVWRLRCALWQNESHNQPNKLAMKNGEVTSFRLHH